MGSPPKLNLDKFRESNKLNLSQFTKSKPTSESMDLRTLAAAAIRGVTGFSPGGFIGAGIGVAGEGLAQSIEPREDYNIPQMLTQGALGAVPFGRVAGIAKSMFKGGAQAGIGNLATSQAEQGLHVPTLEDLGSAAIATGVGSLAGAIRLPEKLLRAKVPVHIDTGEAPKITTPEVEVPKVDLGRREVPKTKGPKKRDLRTGPMIMSEGGPDAGRRIMEEILTESSIPASRGIPEVTAQTARDTKERGSTILSWLNASKATAASGDLSAPLRQGIFLVGRRAWWNAWKPMFQSLRESNYNKINQEIAANPRYNEATSNGLSLTTLERFTDQEEHFASRIAQKIPGVKASERAYITFLNKLRMDLYNDLADKAERLGRPYDKGKLTSYINAATGRGNMALTVGSNSRTLDAAAPLLNTVFFSPRFVASRIQLLNPVSYARMDPFTRREALRDLATLTSVAGTALSLAKMGGLDVEMDPTKTDFGKIRTGNTRIDVLGGFGQYIRFFSQAAKGMMTEEDGPDPRRFIESKLSPTAVMIKEMISGKDYFGRKITIPKSLATNVSPMIARDIYELWKEDPDLVPLSGLSLFGLPAQSYKETKQKGTPSGIPRIRLNLP